MKDIHETNNLYECRRLIEDSIWSRVVNNDTQAKKGCHSAIKRVNTLAKTVRSSHLQNKLNVLSKYLLEYYGSFSNDKSGKLVNFGFKVLWLGSKVSKSTFTPVIHFSDDLTSFDECFVSDREEQDVMEVPKDTKVTFEVVQGSDWSTETEDLGNCYQDLLTNCSFVSAILSLVESGQTDMLMSSIVPFKDFANHNIRMYFNGTERIVSVSNQLPVVHDKDRNLIIKSYSNKNIYWLALIEKAYLKVMGEGYSLRGSNMASDVYMLSGWIPEVIVIHEGGSIELATIWKSFQEQKATLGAGTGKISPEIASKLNLVPEHDYSIVSYSNSTGQITLKNPWVQDIIETRYISLSQMDQMSYLYINWNPSIFRYSTQISLAQIKDSNDYYLYENQQCSFYNNSDTKQEVWLLLESHLGTDSKENTASVFTYITDNGEKVFTPKDSLCVSKDNDLKLRLKLIKLELEPGRYYTSVLYGAPKSTMTVRAYYNISEDFKLVKASPKYPFFAPTLNDKWTFDSSGGNWSLSSYISNPEYHLEVKADCSILLGLFSDHDVFVNIHVFHSSKLEKDQKIRNFDKSKLLQDEKYNQGYHSIRLALTPGHYKVVLSTYTHTTVPYSLICNYSTHSDALHLSKVPSSLGLFSNYKSASWSQSNRVKIHFHVPYSNTSFSFHVTYSSSPEFQPTTLADYRPAMRVSVFGSTNSMPVQINEKWNDSLYGVFVDCPILKPGEYVLLVERFETGSGFCRANVAANRQFSLI